MRPRNPGLLIAAVVALSGCAAPMVLTESDAPSVLAHQEIAGPSPADRGAYEVGYLTYGSGNDRLRAAFRDSVSIVTDSVDGSPFVSFGGGARARQEEWGFSNEGFPLNGRVWYPEGEGRFPLVLIVHGNHNPRDYSDPGYDYLGELLASRGYILASIDMNFINGGIRGENDGRGWLLLKHLEAWAGFDADSENPFHGRVDMSQIALMGHSRGGEAVGHAAAFNRLSRYPDDASVTFDFDFDIRSIVAIAPVDGQYLPTNRKVPVEDVNYLVFHGSHDGDVTSFHGLRQWNRVSYSEGSDFFKSAVYMYRANHGQWNSVWNSHDRGPRSGRSLDLRYLVEPADQRRMAELYVTAFLDITLKGEDRWKPIFRDHRVIGEWLPETMYVTQFEHASFVPLADFEGDIDVTTGAFDGVRIHGDSLATWREETSDLRSSNRANTSSSQENQAVRLGWNNAVRGQEETGPPARWTIELGGEGLARANTGEATSLDLQVMATGNTPRPRANPDPDAESSGGGSAGGDDGEAEDPPTSPVLDFSVEVEDANGRTARVALSSYGPIREPLEIRILRRQDLEASQEHFDPMLQSFHIPLSDFTGIDTGSLRAIRLVFDRTEAGEILLDNVGLSRMGADFWSARVR